VSSSPITNRVNLDGAGKSERFPKHMRLLKRCDFLKVQNKGDKFCTPSLIILVRSNTKGNTRLGISVSKKFGNSVKRNHFKRSVREVFRRNQQLFPCDADVVIIPKRHSRQTNYNTLVPEIYELTQKEDIWKNY
jgi:ribonuclease P protein component